MELVNFLLKCGDDVRLWVSRRLRGQCEQQWGALCHTLGHTCPPGNQSDGSVQNTAATTLPTTVVLPITAQGRRQPTKDAEAEKKRGAQGAAVDAATADPPAFEKANMTVA